MEFNNEISSLTAVPGLYANANTMRRTQLQMVPTTPEGNAVQQEDPIDQLVEEVKVMDVNAIIK